MSMDKHVSELVDFAKEKGIHSEDQQAIVEHITGISDQIFAALPEEYAEDVLDELKTKGHTTVINEATGQAGDGRGETNDGVREAIKNGETEHPVFEDLKQVSSEHDLSSMDEVKISAAVVGKRHHWWQISKDDAAQVLTEIQTEGLEDILEKARNGDGIRKTSHPEAVKELRDFGKEKLINPEDQKDIVAYFNSELFCTFSEADHTTAVIILEAFEDKGYTHWLNKATGQTDITDEDQAETVTLETVSKDDLEDKSLTVYDDEEGGMVEVDPNTRAVANSLQQKMDIATLVTAVVMMRMSDDKLYRGVDKGYSSFREYAEVRCPFGYRQAQRYAKVGRKFAPLLPDGVTSMSPNQQAINGNVEKLGELGMSKLYELSKIEDADLSEIPSEGKVILKDGTEMDIEEIKSQSAREFKRKLDEHRQYQKDLEDELNTTAQERDKALEKKEQMEKEAEVGLKYKHMYGEKSDQFEAQKGRILEARSKAADLNQVLSKIEDLPVEFDGLVDELRDLHKMIDRGLKRLREDNLEALQGIRN